MSQPNVAPINRPRSAAGPAYDRLSGSYDLFAGRFERRLTQRAVALLAPPPAAAALDIGCGTGWGLTALRRAVGSGGHVLGLDLSAGMLHRARRRATADLCQGDGALLPLADGCIDAVLLSFTLELFSRSDIPVVLAACRRVLRPGGRIGVVALSRARGATPAVWLYEQAHKRWPVLVDCRPIHAAQALVVAGFTVQRLQTPRLWGLPVELIIAAKPA
jgi:demethylmenaquinone methyltransferase/2-methoxy-6-polyprenyl-1,4-benzoquinol methylase